MNWLVFVWEFIQNRGMGFREIVYKDAPEYEFKSKGIPYLREKPHKIKYKAIILLHAYNADFIVYDSIIPEVKSSSLIATSFVKQTINYLKASGLKPGIIANFEKNHLLINALFFNSCNSCL